MNLNMIRAKNRPKIYYCALPRIVKRLYTKLELVLKKRLNSNLPNQGKHFNSIQIYLLKVLE